MFFDSISDIDETISNPRLAFFLTGIVALIVVVIFIAPVIGANAQAFYPVHPEYGNIQDVGLVLFTKYLVPFEVAAVMLLVAMIGGIILAGKKMDISITQLSEQEIDKHHTNIEIKKDIK
jgi:NADH-quinone oxidoreductase subunit J